jgi:hypothetical protein
MALRYQTMIRTHNVEQGSNEWHELRRVYPFTGSGAAKLLKFGAINYAKAEHTSFSGNFYTKRGHVLEDEALELYGAIYEREVQRPGFITNSAYHDCGYSPDGIDVTAGILLECKAFNMDRHKSIAKGEIPTEIMAQIQFGMVITGLRKARLILYNPEFAKKEIDNVPNVAYDSSLALVIRDVRYNRNVHSNFKRILKEASNAYHTQTAHA